VDHRELRPPPEANAFPAIFPVLFDNKMQAASTPAKARQTVKISL
jgi:hypothetical protein